MTVESKLANLKREFPNFLRNNNDLKHGRVVEIEDANPSPSLVHGFCSGDTHKLERMVMGVMFHGTTKESIAAICTSGIYDFSCYTSSFDYAVGRSNYKEGRGKDHVHVLAMAVIVEEQDRLDRKDAKTRHPCCEYALPLFVVTVKLT